MSTHGYQIFVTRPHPSKRGETKRAVAGDYATVEKAKAALDKLPLEENGRALGYEIILLYGEIYRLTGLYVGVYDSDDDDEYGPRTTLGYYETETAAKEKMKAEGRYWTGLRIDLVPRKQLEKSSIALGDRR